jgi:hypothetical protein
LFPQQWIQLQASAMLMQWRKKADWRFAQKHDHYLTNSKVRKVKEQKQE